MKNQNIKVVIAPWGGHATSYIRRTMNTYMRPDVIIGASLDIYDMPVSTMKKAWKHRTGTDLDMSISINDNLVKFIRNADRPILLSGGCSKYSPFLTINSIPAMCIVRNPVYAYCSFFSRRHPEKADAHGGINSEELVLWYTERWNNIITDFLQSGNPIIRFEHWAKDVKSQDVGPFKSLVNSIRPNKASTKKPITKQIENLVIEKTKSTYNQVQLFCKNRSKHGS